MAALTLTTPCTINQLIEFVQHQVMPLHGDLETNTAGNVTTTTTSISVA